MKKVAAPLKLDLAQYRELAAFAQFASDLDKATRDQLTRGEKLTEVLKQPQFQPVPVENQVVIIWAATNGFLDDVPTDRLREFETGLYRYLDSSHSAIFEGLREKKQLTDEATEELRRAVAEFKDQGGFATSGADDSGSSEPQRAPAATGSTSTAESAA